MKKTENIRLFLLLFIVCLNIGCDQISKQIVRNAINYQEQITLIKNHVILTKVENTGAFLSAGNDLPIAIRYGLLVILPILVLGAGLFYLFYKTNLPKAMQIGLCFLIGGGIGNVYDRLMYGSVTDFLHIDFGLFRTGIFNLADVSIMVGIGILLIDRIRKKLMQHQRSYKLPTKD